MTWKHKIQEKRGLALVVLLFLLWGIEKFEHQRDFQRHLDRIETLQTQKDKYEVSVDSLGAVSARQEILLLNAKNEYHSLLRDFTSLKNTTAQTKVITRTQIDSVFIPVVSIDTLFVDGSSAPIYSFSDTSEFYSISGKVNSEFALIQDISFFNDITFSHRWERKNLLSKKTYFVEVKNTNPYVQIQGLQNYEIQDKKRIWETGKFWYGLGVATGIMITR
tara:strand:+ start:51 stop:710 length:660 start_codon:yes stop_codon:yes gene_type:complete